MRSARSPDCHARSGLATNPDCKVPRPHAENRLLMKANNRSALSEVSRPMSDRLGILRSSCTSTARHQYWVAHVEESAVLQRRSSRWLLGAASPHVKSKPPWLPSSLAYFLARVAAPNLRERGPPRCRAARQKALRGRMHRATQLACRPEQSKCARQSESLRH